MYRHVKFFYYFQQFHASLIKIDNPLNFVNHINFYQMVLQMTKINHGGTTIMCKIQ